MEQGAGITHEDIDRRVRDVERALDKGVHRFKGIEDRLDHILASVESMATTIKPIRDDISTIKEMTGGWKAIGTVGRFIKWSSGIAVAIGAFALAAKAWAMAAFKATL
jgi:hypothetical protein